MILNLYNTFILDDNIANSDNNNDNVIIKI